MKIVGSTIPFAAPARAFVIDGSVAHPVLPFIQALEKAKFQVTSKLGQSPIVLRYGSFWKSFAADSLPTMIMPAKFQRWELDINAVIDVELDKQGNHVVTVAGTAVPFRGNDYLFEIIAKGADAHARAGQLLRSTEFFQGDPKAMKKQGVHKK